MISRLASQQIDFLSLSTAFPSTNLLILFHFHQRFVISLFSIVDFLLLFFFPLSSAAILLQLLLCRENPQFIILSPPPTCNFSQSISFSLGCCHLLVGYSLFDHVNCYLLKSKLYSVFILNSLNLPLDCYSL